MPNAQEFIRCTPEQAQAEIKAIDKIIASLETRISKAQMYTRFNTSMSLGRALDGLRAARQMYEPRALVSYPSGS